MEKIRKYIKKFFSKKEIDLHYDMRASEVTSCAYAVYEAEDMESIYDVISALFSFGYAKGYRAAMAEMKKGGVTA